MDLVTDNYIQDYAAKVLSDALKTTVHIPLTAKGLKKTRSSQLEDDSELRPIFLLDCVNNGQYILLKIRHS